MVYFQGGRPEAHRAINTRGIGLDVRRAQKVLAVALEHAELALEAFSATTCGMMSSTNLLDDAYVLSWLSQWGHDYPNLHAETMEWALRLPLVTGCPFPPAIEAVFQARLMLASQPVGSLQRALELVDRRGRVRHHLIYHAGSAGTWLSSGIDFQRLIAASQFVSPVTDIDRESSSEDHDKPIIPTGSLTEDVLNSLVASCFVPVTENVFYICRYADLGERILKWLTGRNNREGAPAKPTSEAEMHCELVSQLQRACFNGDDADVAGCRISITFDEIAIRLPSGRSIHHRQLTSFQTSDFAPDPNPPKLRSFQKTDLRHESNARTVLDDILQGIRRDLLAASLILCESAGLPVVVHGSHFIVVELTQSSAETALNSLAVTMSSLPDWAEGMALTVEGYVTSQLGPHDPADGCVLRAQNGTVVN